jgi:NAD(P)-dependent dehydrogenase (short-subunit alcohol dehydrogenase family)
MKDLTDLLREKEIAMLLKDKVALIYGAGGAIGGAVAQTFAREGAKVFLSGRNVAPVKAVAGDSLRRAEMSRRQRSMRST